MLQNHAWVWGQGMRDIISCLCDIASVLKSWWYFIRYAAVECHDYAVQNTELWEDKACYCAMFICCTAAVFLELHVVAGEAAADFKHLFPKHYKNESLSVSGCGCGAASAIF